MESDQKTAPFTHISLRTAAIVAGVGLLMMALLAPFANFYVLQKLVVAGDANATAINILASAGLFRIGIGCFVVVAVLDVVVAWALYLLLEPASRSLSLLAAWFRVVYAAVFTLALSPLLSILPLLNGAEYSGGLETNQLHTQVMLSLSTFRSGWDAGLVFFGFHLLVLGYAVFNSGYIPKWLVILLVIAALGYLADSFGKLLIPNYNLTIVAFTFIGELLLAFWLLDRAVKGFEPRPTLRPQGA